MPPQSLDLFRSILQLRAIHAEIDAAFPVAKRGPSATSSELQRNPQWSRAHIQAKRLLASCLQELSWELRNPNSRVQCTRDQWETLVWTTKHMRLFAHAAQLLQIAQAHLTRLDTTWKKRNRQDWAHRRALASLEEREANILFECIARSPETPVVNEQDGSLSVLSKQELRAALLPTLDEAATLLKTLQSSTIARRFDLSSASSVLLNLFARLVSPPPPSQATSPEDLAAADTAARLIRQRYDQTHPKDPKLHSVMLGAYLRLGAHDSMKRLLSMLESQAAKGEGQPVLAACFGAMLSSVFQQLEVAEVGSDAARSLVQQAERYWKRAKISPQLDAKATWTMMRTCSAVWDVARTHSVLMEAVALEDELVATAALPLESPEAKAAAAAVAKFGPAGPVYADPACFSLLFHTYATRCSDPAAQFSAAQAAWELMLARYVSTRPRGAASLFGEVQWSKTFLASESGPNIDRSRKLRPNRGTIDSWVSFLSLLCSSDTASIEQKHQAERQLHNLWVELTQQMKREHPNIVLALFKAGLHVPNSAAAGSGESTSASKLSAPSSSRLSSLHSLATELCRQGLWTTRTLTGWLSLYASPAFASRSSTPSHERAQHAWGLFASQDILPSAKSYAALMAAQVRAVATGEIAPGSPESEEMLRRVEECWWALRAAGQKARENAATADSASSASSSAPGRAAPSSSASADGPASLSLASGPSLAPPFSFQVSDFAAVFRAMASSASGTARTKSTRRPSVAPSRSAPMPSAAPPTPVTLQIAVPLDGAEGDAEPPVTVTIPPDPAAAHADTAHAHASTPARLSPHIPYDFVQRWISRARVAGLWEQVRSQSQVQSIVYGSRLSDLSPGRMRHRLRSIARGYLRPKAGEIAPPIEETLAQLQRSKQLPKDGDHKLSASKKRAIRRAAINKMRRAGAQADATSTIAKRLQPLPTPPQ